LLRSLSSYYTCSTLAYAPLVGRIIDRSHSPNDCPNSTTPTAAQFDLVAKHFKKVVESGKAPARRDLEAVLIGCSQVPNGGPVAEAVFALMEVHGIKPGRSALSLRLKAHCVRGSDLDAAQRILGLFV
jgi:hypothetical protein